MKGKLKVWHFFINCHANLPLEYGDRVASASYFTHYPLNNLLHG